MRRTVAEHQAAVAGLLRWSSGYDAGAPEILPLADALGRSLATDVPAPVSLPPFDNSQMDGYAVHAADLEDPSHLAVTDAIAAGSVPADLRPVRGLFVWRAPPVWACRRRLGCRSPSRAAAQDGRWSPRRRTHAETADGGRAE